MRGNSSTPPGAPVIVAAMRKRRATEEGGVDGIDLLKFIVGLEDESVIELRPGAPLPQIRDRAYEARHDRIDCIPRRELLASEFPDPATAWSTVGRHDLETCCAFVATLDTVLPRVAVSIPLVLAGCYASHGRDPRPSDGGTPAPTIALCEPDAPALLFEGECVSMEVRGQEDFGHCLGQLVHVLNPSGGPIVWNVGFARVDEGCGGCGYAYWNLELDGCECAGSGTSSSSPPVGIGVEQISDVPAGYTRFGVLLGGAHVIYEISACPSPDP